MKTPSLCIGITLFALLFLAPGCSVLKPRPDLTRFYVLRAPKTQAQSEAPTDRPLPALRIGPGRIAGYLNATPIVTQDGRNRIRYLGLDDWAEPLSKGINRTLGENLARELNLKNVTFFPDPVSATTSWEVHYTVHQFEGTLDGPVQFDVYWELVEQPSTQVLAGNRSVYTVPPENHEPGASGYVERMSRAITLWAADVAAAANQAAPK